VRSRSSSIGLFLHKFAIDPIVTDDVNDFSDDTAMLCCCRSIQAKTKRLFERSFIALRGPPSNVVGSNYYDGEEITIYRCESKKIEALLSVSCGA
jgi:hypothetical protein